MNTRRFLRSTSAGVCPMRDPKEEARSIFLETLKSIQLDSIIKRRLALDGDRLVVDGSSAIQLRDYGEVLLIGLGKASVSLGAALEDVLGEWMTRGLLVTNRQPELQTKSVVIVAGHPLPNVASLKAGKSLIHMVGSSKSDSLIVFAISGGGSSLAELPIFDTVTLDDLRELNRVLIGCGATIREVNTVRKHLSSLKGGRLGYLGRHCRSLALFVSDVNPGDLKSIASNPLLPDDETFDEFVSILERYQLRDRLPASIRNLIDSGSIPPLPLNWDGEEGSHTNVLLLDNSDAVSAAARAAEARGFRVEVDQANAEEKYQFAADALIDKLLAIKQEGTKACLVSGGEVLCEVTGRGFGGRNQEFVLYCAARLAARGLSERIAVLSCGTDGIDGNSSAVGAVADAGVIKTEVQMGFDASSFIAENSSTQFFCEAGGLIVTGPTGNNIRDLRLLVMV